MIKAAYHNIRVVIADDHALVREGFRTMLGRYPDITFVGEAENGNELVDLVIRLKPDIVFTDIAMPQLNGIEAARHIARVAPGTGIIALTIHDDDHLIVDMLEAGARGYLIKNAPKDEIVQAIHAVFDGDTYYCRHTSTKLAHMIAHSRFNPHKKIKLVQFSEKEKSVVRLICQEFSNKEIAAKLKLSVRTIEGYRHSIQEKMDVHSTAGLVVYAIRRGIFKPELSTGEQ